MKYKILDMVILLVVIPLITFASLWNPMNWNIRSLFYFQSIVPIPKADTLPAQSLFPEIIKLTQNEISKEIPIEVTGKISKNSVFQIETNSKPSTIYFLSFSNINDNKIAQELSKNKKNTKVTGKLITQKTKIKSPQSYCVTNGGEPTSCSFNLPEYREITSTYIKVEKIELSKAK